MPFLGKSQERLKSVTVMSRPSVETCHAGMSGDRPGIKKGTGTIRKWSQPVPYRVSLSVAAPPAARRA